MSNWISLVFIAFGLAMDAFAVAICDGIRINNIKKWQGIVIALTFGLFQGIMPVIGYYLGSLFMSYIEAYDHWVAFGLLSIIGGVMIFEGIKGLIKPESVVPQQFKISNILVEGVATSIDALAVGVSLTTLPIFIAYDAIVITSITFVIALIGVLLGQQINKLLKGKYSIANIIGGAILIVLGITILIEHLM